jgi:hypothetical protein
MFDIFVETGHVSSRLDLYSNVTVLLIIYSCRKNAAVEAGLNNVVFGCMSTLWMALALA